MAVQLRGSVRDIADGCRTPRPPKRSMKASDCITPRSSRTSATIHSLPLELLLTILTLLPLKALIAAKNVSQHWRTLVRTAHLHPARRALLALFEHVVHTAPAAYTRPRVAAHHCAHPRDAYLHLLTRGADAPDDFVTWVREWPAWGVFGWLWPALDGRLALRGQPLGEEPHVKSVTFVGGRFGDGAVVRATRILPVECAGLVGSCLRGCSIPMEVDDGCGEEAEESVETTVLLFGGGSRVLVLDVRNGHEDMKGCVFPVVEEYTVSKDTVFSRTWTEYLYKHLLIPHSVAAPAKYTNMFPFMS